MLFFWHVWLSCLHTWCNIISLFSVFLGTSQTLTRMEFSSVYLHPGLREGWMFYVTWHVRMQGYPVEYCILLKRSIFFQMSVSLSGFDEVCCSEYLNVYCTMTPVISIIASRNMFNALTLSRRSCPSGRTSGCVQLWIVWTSSLISQWWSWAGSCLTVASKTRTATSN